MINSYKTLGDIAVVQLAPGETLEEAASQYLNSGLVEFVEPDYKLHAAAAPDDPEYSSGSQWGLKNSGNPGRDINAEEGWETLNSASNVIVAIIDTGIRTTHEDLVGNLWVNPNEIPNNGLDDDTNGFVDDIHGINAINLSGEVNDDAGHGTHVAGVIGAVGNNRIGISGVAWKVQIMACKFLDDAGNGETSDAIRCVDYARRNGAQIINASWGGEEYSAALYTAISNARAAGIIVVTAAGNKSQNIDETPLYPACFTLDNIVVVGGTGRSDTLDLSYSSYGESNVDLCAPGSGIYSTWNSWDGAYHYLSGTSMAAPHVAGVLALMKARFPAMTSAQLISRLYSTVDVLPALSGKCVTGGRVNLGRALGTDPTPNFAASQLSGQPPLSVTFTNLTLGSLKSLSWDFGDGTAISTNSDPTHVFAQNGVFRVRLTVVGTNNRTNSIEQSVQAISNYEVVSEDFHWIDPIGMVPLGLTDNGVSAGQPLPFDFKFFAGTYNSIYVGANGLFGFNPIGLSTTDNSALPNSNNPNAIICPYWDNLNPGAGGEIYVGVEGAEPSRRFVISWVDVPRNSTSVPLTFQAVLEEATDEIVFQYQDVAPETSRGGGKRASIGVEDERGSTGVLYTFNGSPRVLSNQSGLRIKPHGYRYLFSTGKPVRIQAIRGQPIEGINSSLDISNPGTLPLDWSVESAATWLDLTQSTGTLRGGDELSVPLRLTAAAGAMPAGSHYGTVSLKNKTDGSGNSTVSIELVIEEPRSALAIADSSENLFTGGLGGPFDPSLFTVELQNQGNIPLQWKSTPDVAWLLVHPSSGILAPGEFAPVEVTLGATDQFPSGTSAGVVRFENETNPGAMLEQRFTVEVRSRVEQTSASIVNGIFRGELTVSEGSSYQVEFSEDLVNWFALDTIPVLAGTSLKFQDPVNAATGRFYRVRVE